MKVLREGKVNVSIEVECKRCEALLEVQSEDITVCGGGAFED